MAKTLIETGTPERLAAVLAEKAPSLDKGRYKLVVRPETDDALIAEQLAELFAAMDEAPEPNAADLTEDQVMDLADRLIAKARADTRAKRSA